MMNIQFRFPVPDLTPDRYDSILKRLTKFIILIGVIIGLVGFYDFVLLLQPDVVNRGFYALIEAENILSAVVFIWLGIASKSGKRWALRLLLILSWFWLLAAPILFPMFYLFTIGFLDSVGLLGVGHLAPFIFKIITVLCLSLVYVIFPSGLILFINGWLIKSGFNTGQLNESPLPVLALSLIFGWGIISSLFMLVFLKPVVPFFGKLLTGSLATLTILGFIVGLGLIGWGFYRLRLWAIQLTMISTIVIGFSFLMTFSKINFLMYFLKMNIPVTPLMDLGLWRYLTVKPPIQEANLFIIFMFSAFFGYAVLLNKYFKHT
jgi:hypothetical protein